MNHRILSVLLLITLVMAIGIKSAFASSTKSRNFKLPDIHTQQDTKLSDFKGKIIYLDFWASWCGPCKKSLPLLNELRNELNDHVNFEVIAINLDTNIQDAKTFLKKHPVDYPVLSDPYGQSALLYGVSVMPSSYLINTNGVVVSSYKGFKNKDIAKIKAHVKMVNNK